MELKVRLLWKIATLRWLVVYKLRSNDSINAYLEQLHAVVASQRRKFSTPYASDFVINSYGES